MEDLFKQAQLYKHALDIMDQNDLCKIRIEKKEDGAIVIDCNSDYYGIVMALAILLKEISKPKKFNKKLFFKEIEAVVKVMQTMDKCELIKQQGNEETAEEELNDLFDMIKNIKKEGK